MTVPTLGEALTEVERLEKIAKSVIVVASALRDLNLKKQQAGEVQRAIDKNQAEAQKRLDKAAVELSKVMEKQSSAEDALMRAENSARTLLADANDKAANIVRLAESDSASIIEVAKAQAQHERDIAQKGIRDAKQELANLQAEVSATKVLLEKEQKQITDAQATRAKLVKELTA